MIFKLLITLALLTRSLFAISAQELAHKVHDRGGSAS